MAAGVVTVVKAAGARWRPRACMCGLLVVVEGGILVEGVVAGVRNMLYGGRVVGVPGAVAAGVAEFLAVPVDFGRVGFAFHTRTMIGDR